MSAGASDTIRLGRPDRPTPNSDERSLKCARPTNAAVATAPVTKNSAAVRHTREIVCLPAEGVKIDLATR